LTEVLKQEHDVKPVHTLEEITLLQNKFPGNIKLHTCLVNERVEAGVLIFEHENTAHAQYISASRLSREAGLLDALLYEVILSYQSKGFKYFDFGISTENGGRYLNTGLAFQKEGFGARTTCYDMYAIAL
jgi:CelD/BcsL family acetyltransferase involved in cellulose biosynthesis